jgi:hypothetical protein
MSNFTPGPWHVSYRWWITDDAKQTIARMDGTHPATPIEYGATAHLIASAPDLYAALARIRQELRGERARTDDAVLAEIIGVILAKARGERGET